MRKTALALVALALSGCSNLYMQVLDYPLSGARLLIVNGSSQEGACQYYRDGTLVRRSDRSVAVVPSGGSVVSEYGFDHTEVVSVCRRNGQIQTSRQWFDLSNGRTAVMN